MEYTMRLLPTVVLTFCVDTTLLTRRVLRAACFVKRDRTSNGGTQAFGWSAHGDTENSLANRLPSAWAVPLVSDDRGHRTPPLGIAKASAIRCQSLQRNACRGALGGHVGGLGNRQGQAERRAHGPAHDLGMIRIDAKAPKDGSRAAKGLGRSQ